MKKITFILYLSLAVLLALIILTDGLQAEDKLREPQWIGLALDRGGVSLSWFRVQGAVRYLVERRTGEAGEFQEIGETVKTAHSDFKVLPGQSYFYRIIPLDEKGIRGPVSEIRFILTESAEPDAALPPRWASSIVGGDGIALSWEHPDAENVLAYNLYRKKEGEDTFTLITSSLSSTYRDRDVQPGANYQYFLTAFNLKLQESDSSEILEMTFTAIPEAAPAEERIALIKTLEEVVDRTVLERIYTRERYGFVSPVDVEHFSVQDRLYVSDPGTGLITVIEPDGEVVKQLGGNTEEVSGFERLLGIAVDGYGFVYGVDAYRGEIVVFSPNGAFNRRISLKEKVTEYYGKDLDALFPGFRFGLVDVVATDSGFLVVVDNPNGFIYLLNRNDTVINVISEKGYQPSRLQYPTFAVLDQNQRILVSDSMNARVQVFAMHGPHIRQLGERGPGIGQFLRPKGIALDRDGNIYIADSQQNVIQVFNDDLEFMALLGDENGFPIDLGSPNGITFVGSDLIAVAEKLAGRVQIRRLLKMSSRVEIPGTSLSLRPLNDVVLNR